MANLKSANMQGYKSAKSLESRSRIAFDEISGRGGAIFDDDQHVKFTATPGPGQSWTVTIDGDDLPQHRGAIAAWLAQNA